jgi:hypothetical protein
MPAGIGSTGRNGRAGRQTLTQTIARTPAHIIFQRRKTTGDFSFFMSQP